MKYLRDHISCLEISILIQCMHTIILKDLGGFRGGAVVGSLPAGAGVTGSSPGLGGSHVPRSD